MGAIQRRVGRLEAAAASHGYSHEEALREMNRRDEERQAFSASASEADLIAKLHAIDMDEAGDVAELSNPPEPPPEGTAHRWFYDLRHSQSAADVREFHDQFRRPVYVAALADRKGGVPQPPAEWRNPEGWRLEWAKGVIAEARALAEHAPIAAAIVAAMRSAAAEKPRALMSAGRP